MLPPWSGLLLSVIIKYLYNISYYLFYCASYFITDSLIALWYAGISLRTSKKGIFTIIFFNWLRNSPIGGTYNWASLCGNGGDLARWGGCGVDSSSLGVSSLVTLAITSSLEVRRVVPDLRCISLME